MQIFQVKQNRERYTGSWTNIVILVGVNDLGYNGEDCYDGHTRTSGRTAESKPGDRC